MSRHEQGWHLAQAKVVALRSFDDEEALMWLKDHPDGRIETSLGDLAELFGWRSGLDLAPRRARRFYLVLGGSIAAGMVLDLFDSNPIRMLFLSAVLNDQAGVLDFAGGPVAKKRLDERLRTLRAESPLPWVEAPPAWALALFVEAGARHAEAGAFLPAELARWLKMLPAAAAPADPPIYDRVPAAAVAADPTLLDRSAEVLALPELAGWFLDPPSVQAEALDLLQAKESRLVVSDQIKAERVAALIDRVIDAHFTHEARRRWQRRLEETAFVLAETGRPAPARLAVAAALALGDAERPARHIPFVRALAERSLDVASEVALGRLPADEVSRRPRHLEMSRAR